MPLTPTVTRQDWDAWTQQRAEEDTTSTLQGFGQYLRDLGPRVEQEVQSRWRTAQDAAMAATEQAASMVPTLPDVRSLLAGTDYEPPEPVQAPTYTASGVQPTSGGPGVYAGTAQPSSPEPPPAPELSPGGTPIRSSGEMAVPAPTGDLRAYTRAKAASLGIDPDVAERVFGEGEGGFDDPVRQSDVVYQGRREESYGPAQMNMTGGLGTALLQERGVDVRDPKNVYAGIDYALEHAVRNGWGAFHGAARVGVGEREGIGQTPRRPSSGQPVAMPEQASSAHNHADEYEVAFGFNQAYNQPFNAAIPRHRGVDLVVRGAKDGGRGAPVRAFRGGTVYAVTSDPNGGNGLIVATGDPDAPYDYYGHFDAVGVKNGQQIAPGEQVGVLGASGTEGFPHLHYEVRRAVNGDPQDALIDPTPYMRGGNAPAPNASAGAPPAGAPSPPSAAAGAGRGGAGAAEAPPDADMVTIQHIDDGKTKQVPRSQLPGWLQPIAPTMPPMWRVVDGPQAQMDALDAARASTAGTDDTMARLPMAQRPAEVTPEAPVYGTPGLGDQGGYTDPWNILRPQYPGLPLENIPDRDGQMLRAPLDPADMPLDDGAAPPMPPVRDDWRAPEPEAPPFDPSEGGVRSPAPVIPGPDQSDQGTPIVAPAPVPEPEPAPSPFKPLYDAGGAIVGYVQGVADQAYQALEPARQAAAALDNPEGYGQVQAFPGEADYSPPAGAVGRALMTPVKPPPIEPDRSPPRPGEMSMEQRARVARGEPLTPDEMQAILGRRAGRRTSLEEDAQAVPYQAAEAGRQSVQEAAQAFADAIRAGQEGRTLAQAGNALWGAVQIAGLPWTVAERTVSAMIPEANIGGVGAGVVVNIPDLVKLAAAGVNGLKRSGALLSPENLAAVHDATGNAGRVVQQGAEMMGRGARALGEEAAERLAPAARAVPDDGTQMLGSGVVPSGGVRNATRSQQANALPELPPESTRSVEDAVAAIRNRRTPEQQQLLDDSLASAEEKLQRQAVVRAEMPGATTAQVNARIKAEGAALTKTEEAARLGFTGQEEIADVLREGQVVPARAVAGMLGQFPTYLNGVVDFIMEQRQKLVTGALTEREVAKALIHTVGSMQAGAMRAEKLRPSFGQRIKNLFVDDGKVRPEEAIAAWFLTARGRRALDSLASGKITQRTWEDLLTLRDAYGNNTLRNMGVFVPMDRTTKAMQWDAPVPRYRDGTPKQYDLRNLNELTAALNASRGDPEALQAVVSRIKGIGAAKPGFVKHLLGFGKEATFDAVEMNLWLTGRGDTGKLTGPAADLARAAKLYSDDQEVTQLLFDQIRGRFDELRAMGVGADLNEDVYNHILHHWIWDKAKGLQTTHAGMYEAMRNAAGLDYSPLPGLRADAFNAAQGGVLGAVSEDLQAQSEGRDADPSERVRRALGAGALAVAGGRAARRGPAGTRSLGSGVVPEPNQRPTPAIEQALKSDYGRRIQNVRPMTESVEDLADAKFPRDAVHPDIRGDVSGPVGVPTFMAGRLNAAIPGFDPASAAAGGAAGAMTGEEGDPGRTAAGVAVAGILGRRFPVAQRAVQAAQKREAAMVARGLTRPSAWEWLKQAGYAGIYGPATLVNSAVGGAQELVMGQPKEFVRALVAGRPGSYGKQAAAQLRAMPEGLTGLARVLLGSDSAATAAVSGGSQGTANLSERVVNPVGHLAARILERPGEILTEAPDAVFRPMFLAQGMRREADKIASEMGMRGSKAASYADALMQSAEQLRANPSARSTSAEAQRVVKAGADYADELGYKGDPGGFGRWLGQTARRDDAIGVAASFLVPFPSMAARMSRAALRSTPGVGLLPSVRRGQPTRFDVVYDQAFGTLVASGIAAWAFNGGITGSGPTDKEKRDMMIAEGWQPGSTLVAGHYIPNRAFGRFQPMLDTAGEIHDALAYGKKDRKPGEMVAELVKRGSRIATDQTGLSGLADLHDMLNQGFESRFPGWATRSTLRYVPYSGVLRAVAASLDTKQRRAEKWGDETIPTTAIVQNAALAVPGLRESVPAVQDVLGREAPNPQQGLGAVIPRTTTRRDDPVVSLFQEAGVDIGKASDAITVGRVSGVSLKPAEQRRWNEHRGRFIEDYADAYTSNPDFMALPPAQKEKYLKAFLTKAADYADKVLQSEMDVDDLTNRATEQAVKKAS